MDISPAELGAQYARAAAQWGFIDAYNDGAGLPSRLLYAVGSRETNLSNEVGDGGHGHGVWQLDDRSHTIPTGFDTDVAQQCQVAASMLGNLLHDTGGDLRAALAAYNAGLGTVTYDQAHGLDVDSGTAGGDYSADVAARLAWLQAHGTVATPKSEDDDMDVVCRNDSTPALPLLLFGPAVFKLQQSDAEDYAAAGYPASPIDPVRFANFEARAKPLASGF